MTNNKYFCLHCFKTFKRFGNCCKWPLFEISAKARPPKLRAHKSEWKRFFERFLNGYNASRGQLKRIIEIRKEYGLSTMDQERNYDDRVEKHESQFRFLDIKRHNVLLEVNQYDNAVTEQFVKEVCGLVHKYEEQKVAKKFNLNKKYFMVPIYAADRHTMYFSPSEKRYGIFKVIVSKCDKTKDYQFKIVTNNINETYYNSTSHMSHSNIYMIRQSFLIFETMEQARAFRHRYYDLLIPYFKGQKKGLVKHLVKASYTDAKHVMRRAPELFI